MQNILKIETRTKTSDFATGPFTVPEPSTSAEGIHYLIFTCVVIIPEHLEAVFFSPTSLAAG